MKSIMIIMSLFVFSFLFVETGLSEGISSAGLKQKSRLTLSEEQVNAHRADFAINFSPGPAGENPDPLNFPKIPAESQGAESVNGAMNDRGVNPLPPELSVSPLEILDEFISGERANYRVTITNESDSVIHWDTMIEMVRHEGMSAVDLRDHGGPGRGKGPSRDDEGDVIAEYNMPYSYNSGLVWDGSVMWGIFFNVGRLVAISPDDGEIVRNFEIHERPRALTFVDNNLWMSSSTDRNHIWVYNREGELIDELELPVRDIGGLAYDYHGYLYISEWDRQRLSVFSVRNEEIVAQFNYSEVFDFGQGYLASRICWADYHVDGPLWAVIGNWDEQTFYAVRFLVTDDWEIEEVQHFQLQEISHVGLAHDGTNLWHGGYFQDRVLYVYDDGIEEAHWISVDPVQGVIPVEDEAELTVTLDTQGLIEGEYSALLHILSDDVDDPDVAVFIWIDVTGIPDILATWNDVNQNMINWNNFFHDLMVGTEYNIPVTILNEGTARLNVTGIESNNERFSAAPAEFTVSPRQSRTIQFSFITRDEGVANGMMTIESNDPDNGRYAIRLRAEAFRPPEIIVEPVVLLDSLFTGEVGHHIISLSNDGGLLLSWEIEVDPEGPDNDHGRHRRRVRNVTSGNLSRDLMLIRLNFDDRLAGADFDRLNALRDEYVDLGVRFRGRNGQDGGAIINSDADFEVRGFSDPNFLGFNRNAELEDGGIPCPPQVLFFNEPVEWVSAMVASSQGSEASMRAYDRLNQLITSSSVPLTGMMREISVEAEGIERVVIDAPVDLFVIDDICFSTDLDWISIDPNAGFLRPGEDREVFIDLDVTGFIAGDYADRLLVTSNDPDDPVVEIDILVNVEGAPDITVIWEIGREENVIDWNAYFDEVFVGHEFIVPVLIRNDGTDDLVIEDIDADNRSFYSVPDEFRIEAGGTQVFQFVFDPDVSGDYRGIMTIYSDDPDEDEINIDLHGSAAYPPEIMVDPLIIEHHLMSNEAAERLFNISNEGETLLTWNLEIEPVEMRGGMNDHGNPRQARRLNGPVRDDPGDLLNQFQVPYTYTTGMAWDGVLMWGVAYRNNRLYALDPVSGEIVHNFQIHAEPTSLAFDGTNFWIGSHYSDRMYIWNRRGELIDEFRYRTFDGLASDQRQHIFVNTYGGDRPLIMVLEIESREQIGEIDYQDEVENRDVDCIEWVRVHREGQLWCCVNGRAYQLFIDDDWNASRVQMFNWNTDEEYVGIAHDGENIWHGMRDESRWYVHDDGTEEFNWIDATPTEGDLAFGEDADIIILLDADDLFTGMYSSEIHIYSNDPDDPDVVVRVNLEVTGVPEIELSWEHDDNENEICWNDYFDEIFVGGEYTIPVTIYNRGTEVLNIEDISADEAVFSSVPDALQVGIREMAVVDFVFEPAEEGDVASVMVVMSDDGDEQETLIDLRAAAEIPPELSVQPDEISAQLSTGETDERLFTLTNQGGALLRWETEIQFDDEQGFRRQQRDVRNIYRNQGPPLRDDAGDIISTLDVPYPETYGMEWDGELMWAISFEARRFYTMDPSNGEVVNDFNLNTLPTGLAMVGDVFWIPGEGSIWEYDREGNQVQQFRVPFNADFVTMTGISDDMVLMNDLESGLTYVYTTDELEEIARFNVMEVLGMQGFVAIHCTWADAHRNAPLWVQVGNWDVEQFFAVQFAVDDEWNIQEVSRFQFEVPSHVAIEHDGTNLWHGGRFDQREWFLFDDGVDELAWLTLDPANGELEVDREAEIELILNAFGLEGGEYAAAVHFLSNDINNPDVEIPVVLEVEAAPDIDISWQIGLGENLINWNEYYDEVYVSVRYVVPVEISNHGVTALEIAEISSGEASFTSNPAELTIEPGEEIEVEFVFAPEDEGVCESVMTVSSNDPDEAEISIDLVAGALFPPEIFVTPSEIRLDMLSDELAERFILLSNTGSAVLRWETEIEIIAEPGDEFRARQVRSINRASHGPRRDEPGDVLATYDIPFVRTTGLAWDGDLMWGVWQRENRLLAIDPDDGELVSNFEIHGGPTTMTFDGTLLYIGSGWGNQLFRYDRQGEIIDNMRLINFNFDGIAYDHDGHLLLNAYGGNDGAGRIHVLNIDDYQEIATIDYIDLTDRRDVDCIEWVPAHKDGQLWCCVNGRAYQLYVDDDWNAELVQMFAWNTDEEYVGIAHDGENLWHGMRNEARLYVNDDGVDELQWIELELDEGEVESGEEVVIFVLFDTERILEGDYEAVIHFLSNDPDDPDVSAAVFLHVTGLAMLTTNPVARPSENADIIDFGNLFVETDTVGIPVRFENFGNGLLEIRDVIIQNGRDFGTDIEAGFEIAPGETRDFELSVHPAVTGLREGRIDVFTNAVNIGEGDEAGHIWFDLAGTGVRPPEIAVDRAEGEEIFLLMNVDDDPVEESIIISNRGGENAIDLVFSIDYEEVEEEVGFMSHQVGERSFGVSSRTGKGEKSRKAIRTARNIAGKSGFSRGSFSQAPLAPVRDDPGDLLQEYDVRDPTTTGLAWDGQLIWGISYSNNRLWALNPETGEMVHDFPTGEDPLALTFDGTHLWVGLWRSNNVQIFDLEGNLVETLEMPFANICGMASDENDFVILNAGGGDSVYVISLDDHEPIAEFSLRDAIGNDDVWSLTWVARHPTGQLWGLAVGHAYQMSLDDQWQVERVQNFDWNTQNEYEGIAHDEVDLWHGSWNDNVLYRHDDGVVEVFMVDWIEAQPEEGVIPAGESAEVILHFDPHGLGEQNDYFVDLVILSNDSLQGEIRFPIHLSTDVTPTHFVDFLPTDLVHAFTVEAVSFNGYPVDSRWEIGIFTPGNILAGAAVWKGTLGIPTTLAAYGDNPRSEEVEGFNFAENFRFRIWDPASDREYDQIETVIIDGNRVWVPGGQTNLMLNGFHSGELAVNLEEGWNLVSINLAPPPEFWTGDQGPDIELLTRQLAYVNDQNENDHHIILMKDNLGNFYSPEQDFNNIPFWNLEQGYMVKSDADVSLELQGRLIPARSDIHLQPGWNMIAYYPEYELDASAPDFHVLSPILDYISIAKNNDGQFMLPRDGFSNMPPWRVTQGYQVYLNHEEAVILNYPPEAVLAAGRVSHELAGIPDQGFSSIAATVTGENMSLLVNSLNGFNRENPSDYHIVAYSPGGIMVGAGRIDPDGRCGLALWGDDVISEAVDGLRAGETVELKLVDLAGEVIDDLRIVKTGRCAELLYNANDVLVVDLETSGSIPNEYYISRNYPNPFNSATRFTFGNPGQAHVSIVIYDVAGRQVIALHNDNLPAGIHEFIWNAADHAAGVYLVRVKAGSFRKSMKIVLVK